jgi:hypothetical protein
MSTEDVVIHFTGGKDSTLLAALLGQQFRKVHLLTFVHSLILDLDTIPVNIHKLQSLYGRDKYESTVIDIEQLFRKIYVGNYLRDIARYRTYAANNACGPCRLSMITHAIIYCLKNGIRFVRDGSNRTGFDVCQQEWALPVLKDFYGEYGIDLNYPLYHTSRNDVELLRLGLYAGNPVLFFRSQPVCRGGGEVHNIYLRCYFLPLYGREARQKRELEWLEDKLQICREYIANHSADVLATCRVGNRVRA